MYMYMCTCTSVFFINRQGYEIGFLACTVALCNNDSEKNQWQDNLTWRDNLISILILRRKWKFQLILMCFDWQTQIQMGIRDHIRCFLKTRSNKINIYVFARMPIDRNALNTCLPEDVLQYPSCRRWCHWVLWRGLSLSQNWSYHKDNLVPLLSVKHKNKTYIHV